MRVVDALEPVQIDEQQRQRPAAARARAWFPAAAPGSDTASCTRCVRSSVTDSASARLSSSALSRRDRRQARAGRAPRACPATAAARARTAGDRAPTSAPTRRPRQLSGNAITAPTERISARAESLRRSCGRRTPGRDSSPRSRIAVHRRAHVGHRARDRRARTAARRDRRERQPSTAPAPTSTRARRSSLGDLRRLERRVDARGRYRGARRAARCGRTQRCAERRAQQFVGEIEGRRGKRDFAGAAKSYIRVIGRPRRWPRRVGRHGAGRSSSVPAMMMNMGALSGTAPASSRASRSMRRARAPASGSARGGSPASPSVASVHPSGRERPAGRWSTAPTARHVPRAPRSPRTVDEMPGRPVTGSLPRRSPPGSGGPCWRVTNRDSRLQDTRRRAPIRRTRSTHRRCSSR